MTDDLHFRFSILGLPNGEALTESELERKLLAMLDSQGGKCRDTLWSLTVLYQKLGNFDQATACMRQVIELSQDPETIGSAFLALGQLAESKGEYVAAAKYYREALALEPCSAQTWYFIHNNLGYSLNQLGEYASAMPYFQKAFEIDPARPNAYKNLGLAHQGLGDLVRAAELFIAATQVDASDPRSLNHLLDLIEANPILEVDIPDLRDRVEACSKAVEVARAHQPDFNAHWQNLREAQRPKWWQFWKRRG